MSKYLITRSTTDHHTFCVVTNDGLSWSVSEVYLVSRRESSQESNTDELPKNIVTEDLLIPAQLRHSIESNEFVGYAGVLRHPSIIFHTLALPFAGRAKVEQILPSQVQDDVPFEVDDLLFCSRLIGKEKEGQFHFLSSHIDSSFVDGVLRELKSCKIDPRILTSESQALAGLISDTDSKGTDSMGCSLWCSYDLGHYSLCITAGGRILTARDQSLDDEHFTRELALTIRRFESSSGMSIESITNCGSFPQWPPQSVLERDLGRKVSQFRLQQTETNSNEDHGEHLWAIGIAKLAFQPHAHSTVSPRPRLADLSNFRVGQFAYRANFRAVIDSAKEKATFFLLAFLVCCLWFGVRLYSQERTISVLNSAIAEGTESVFGSGTVPSETEIGFIQDKILEREEELKGLGTITSLSPLDSLRKLSEAIGPNIDVSIDKISLSYTKVTFRGLAVDHPTVGRLETALKTIDGLCDVRVNPNKKAQGSSRYQYEAEFRFCNARGDAENADIRG